MPEQVWADFNDSEAEAVIRFESGDAWHPFNSGKVYGVSYRCETCGFRTINRREIWDHAHHVHVSEAHQ